MMMVMMVMMVVVIIVILADKRTRWSDLKVGWRKSGDTCHRQGVREIHACEMNDALCAVAREVQGLELGLLWWKIGSTGRFCICCKLSIKVNDLKTQSQTFQLQPEGFLHMLACSCRSLLRNLLHGLRWQFILRWGWTKNQGQHGATANWTSSPETRLFLLPPVCGGFRS